MESKVEQLKPVAWLQAHANGGGERLSFDKPEPRQGFIETPLYPRFEASLPGGWEDAIEAAAKVAERYNFEPERTERDNARNATAQIIAKAIRALTAPPASAGEVK